MLNKLAFISLMCNVCIHILSFKFFLFLWDWIWGVPGPLGYTCVLCEKKQQWCMQKCCAT